MNPIRRELLNGLLVLVVASLLSVAFSAFQFNFNAQSDALNAGPRGNSVAGTAECASGSLKSALTRKPTIVAACICTHCQLPIVLKRSG
jgi:hypothetical protein